MNGVIENEFNPNSVENPFTFGGAIVVGNNDVYVAPRGDSTFVVDPNIAVSNGIIVIPKACMPILMDENGRAVNEPTIEEIDETLRDLAEKNGFGMWCPGAGCISGNGSIIDDPFGEKDDDDDKMYPTKVGGSRVDEHGPYKNRKECLSYCNKEIGPALLEGLGLGVAGSIVTNIINLRSAAFSLTGIQYAIMTALSGAFGVKILIGFLAARITWIYGGCVLYCVKNWK